MRLVDERFTLVKASDSKTIRLFNMPYCQGCNLPISSGTKWCQDCKTKRAPFSDKHISNVVTLSIYIKRDEMKKIENVDNDVDICELKRGRYLDDFAHWMVDLLNTRDLLYDNSVLIPIPSGHTSSERAVIDFAKAISENIDGSRVEQILKLTRPVKSQKYCHGEERETNISNSMATKYPGNLSGKYVYIVDDIITSGWTMREAARVVHSLKPKKIICLAAARTVGPGHLKQAGAMSWTR